MKKYIAALIISAFMMGCGAQTGSVAPADETKLAALEVQQKSDGERIAKLEKELSETKEALERTQRQSKQLGDSYDALVVMLKEYRQLIATMMDNVSKMMKSEPKKDAPKN
jgi:septal ring factor EnvC (AmiA/AmiB activator)